MPRTLKAHDLLPHGREPVLARALDHEAADDVVADHGLHVLRAHHLHERLVVQIAHLRHDVPLQAQVRRQDWHRRVGMNAAHCQALASCS